MQWTPSRRGLRAENTIYQALRLVRVFYRWALAHQLVDRDPMADWILPRPRTPDERLLTPVEVLRLFNLPDLATPLGQRDAVMLGLLYHREFGTKACITVRCHQLTWSPDEDATLRTAFDRYVSEGRIFQLRQAPGRPLSDILLLTDEGLPLTSFQAIQGRLRSLGRQLGHPKLNVRILHKSKRANQASLSRRQIAME